MNNSIVKSFLSTILLLIFLMSCNSKGKQDETTDWQYFYNTGDSLLNCKNNVKTYYFAELKDGTLEQVLDVASWDKEYESFINVIKTASVNIYINVPYSESGDWENELAYIYDSKGNLKVLIRKSSFFNSICIDGMLSEKEVFANESGQFVKMEHVVYDENNHILKDTSECVFNYRFKFPRHLNYKDLPVVQKYKNILK